jgi:opacity protein-like surface antigen
MKRGILALVVSSALLLAAAPALAAGPYVGLEGGVTFLSDSSFDVAGINVGDIKFDTGWGVGLTGGYDFGTWRLEGELVYRANDVKEFSDSAGSSPLDGDVSSTALMVNAYYDFRTISPSVIPYVGAGIGAAFVTADVTDPDPVSGGKVLDDDDTVFAYQLIAGVAFPVSKELAIDLNYRYFGTTDPSFEIVGGGGVSGDAEVQSHNIFVGLRYSF